MNIKDKIIETNKMDIDSYFVLKIIDMHHVQYFPKEKILVLEGPIKVDYFVKLKKYIFSMGIDIKVILVKKRKCDKNDR